MRGPLETEHTTVAPLLRTNEPGSAMQSHERTAFIAKRVLEAKSRKLTCSEWCIKALGALFTLPTLGLSGLIIVPANTSVAIMRFGKLDRVISKPGFAWVAPFYERIQGFRGTNTYRLDSLHVLDGAGNPIIVRALLEYGVEDPGALFIATQNNIAVLYNMAEMVVRVACSHLPLLGERGQDIRSNLVQLGDQMVATLHPDASVLGVSIQRLSIVEARYSPEIAASMLMKQSAGAMVAARKEIVVGALSIVNDTLGHYTTMSEAGKERLITSMLVSLTSHNTPTPTINVGSA